MPPDDSPDATSDTSDDAPDTPESVFAVLLAGAIDLTDDQLFCLSDLNQTVATQLIGSFSGLDPAGRFALLDTLVDAERAGRLLNFSALYRAAQQDEDPGVRGLSVAGLAISESPEVLSDILESAQSDPDDAVRSEAAVGLGAYALRAELGQLRPGLAEQVVETLRAIATDSSEDPTVLASAIASLGVISQGWVQELVYDAYESDDPALRIGALQAMGRTADEYWLPTLINAMDASESDERYAAARAAGEIANEDAIIPLAQLLDDEALDVVEAAAAALGEIGGPVATEQLQGYASHPDAEVRGAIQLGLAAAAFDDDPLGLTEMAGPFQAPLDQRSGSSDAADGWDEQAGSDESDD